MEEERGFRVLSHEEFGRLSAEEKIAYLAKAVEALKSGVPPPGRPPADGKDEPGA